uniref:Rho-GAP domain-containing protein n=1 Tax=Romanomermis culicivorax TaxID=13658 RepID=A0A915I400_ROMCU
MISEQRLTFDDIPVIVEKCVNFIAVHGINVEGIHRLSGTASKVKQLFDDFQRDPYSVHLRIEDYCVHDVASVLRKFLRQLKEPLITTELRSSFIEASCVQEAGTRHLQCKLLLRQLPLINYRTLRKILSHLKYVADNCQTNMMNVQNLSAIFGPTLFTVDRDDIEGINFTSTSQAILLTADMILYFNWLFDVDEAELAKEIIIQQVAKDLTQHQTK